MKSLLVLLLLTITLASKAQDYKQTYWKYADSMWIKHFQRDTIAKNRYIDSMAKYSRLQAATGRKQK